MKILTLIATSIFTGVLMLACSANSPKSTVEKMRKEACEGNVAGFFSYIDKPAVNSNFKESAQNYMKENTPDPQNQWETLGQSLGDSLVDTMVNTLTDSIWTFFENDVKSGKSGNLCKLMVVSEKKDNNTVTVKIGPTNEMVWGFREDQNKWMLVSLLNDEMMKNTPETEEQKKITEKAKEESMQEFVEDDGDYDFRKTRWGMSRDEVKKREKSAPKAESEGEIDYSDRVAGLNATVGYVFIDNKLVSCGYLFDEPHSNKNQYISDYETLKNAFIKKYGQPADDQTIWKGDLYRDRPDDYGFAVSLGDLTYYATWETPKTEITLSLRGDNYKIYLMAYYQSKELKDLQQKSDEKEIEDKL